MPRPVPLQTAFTAGEVAPTIYSRPDVQKYFSAAQIVENYVHLPQGGVTRRPGTRMVAEVRDSSILTIVRPFVFSTTQAYILEISGGGATRFYRNNARLAVGGTPVSVTTPYAATELYDLDFVQSADVLYYLHASYQPRRLERYGDTCWRYRGVTFKPPPSFEYGARPGGDVVPSAVGGDNVTFEARNVASFLDADCGREILVTAGVEAGARAGIKSFTDSQHVVGTICDQFVTLGATCNGSWKITGSPLCGVTPSAKDPVGAPATLTLTLPGWRDSGFGTDVGRFAMINGGQYEITAVTSSTVAQAVIRGTASATTKAESGTWSLEETLWSSASGFPESGDFFDDRLYLTARHRFCGSKVGDYENFGLGILDDDAVIFPINSKSINTIRTIVGGRQLQLFTAAGEYVAKGGGVDDPITPTNIRVTTETTHGSRGVSPVRVNESTLFVTQAGKQIREFTIPSDSVSEVYTAPDLLLLAEHLTEGTRIVEIVYQREPRSTLWALRDDGVLLACAYRREENVVAWSRHSTCGSFESVAVIPHPDGDRDQVWVVTRRIINGATKRFVEYFDDCTFFYSQLHLDCAMTCEPGSAVTTVGVGNYLAGQGVKIVADGVVVPDATVDATGRITLTTAASKIEVGLPYVSTVQTLRPEVAVGGQTSQTSKLRWVELFIKFFRTVDADVRTDQTSRTRLTFNATCSISDQRITRLGWDCGVVTVQQTQPLPSTVLLISGVLDLGGA